MVDDCEIVTRNSSATTTTAGAGRVGAVDGATVDDDAGEAAAGSTATATSNVATTMARHEAGTVDGRRGRGRTCRLGIGRFRADDGLGPFSSFPSDPAAAPNYGVPGDQ